MHSSEGNCNKRAGSQVPAAKLGRRDTHDALERLLEAAQTAKTGVAGDALDGPRRFFEEPAAVLDAGPQPKLLRSAAQVFVEQVVHGAGTDGKAMGEVGNAFRTVGVALHIGDDGVQNSGPTTRGPVRCRLELGYDQSHEPFDGELRDRPARKVRELTDG